MVGRPGQYIPPRGSICAVQFGVADSRTAVQNSQVEVVLPDQLVGGAPVVGGVYDPHMGASDRANCTTCGATKSRCLGHPGHIALPDGACVYSPMFLSLIKTWLQITCSVCSRVVFTAAELAEYPPAVRFSRLSKKATTKRQVGGSEEKRLRPCPYCYAERPIIGRPPEDKTAFAYVLTTAAGGKRHVRIGTREVRAQLERVPEADVAALGFAHPDLHHPRRFILTALPVLPTCMRPESHSHGARARIDDQTQHVKMLVVARTTPPTIIEETGAKDDALLNRLYIECIYGSGASAEMSARRAGTHVAESLKHRLAGKRGRIRGNILGRMTTSIARGTICGDAQLQPGEIGFPVSEARRLQLQERVTPINYPRLNAYYLNGRSVYPGCSKIVKADGTEYAAEGLAATTRLEVGDVVFRDLVAGDYVLFNRPPSLWEGSIICMRVTIHHDRVIRMNVLVCKLFNADFDGDAMAVKIITNEEARIEAEYNSGLHNFFISPKNSTSSMGQVQDSVVGTAMLTTHGVAYDRRRAMRAYARTTLSPALPPGDRFTGRDLVSHMLQAAGLLINFARRPTMFKTESQLPYVLPHYDASDARLTIHHGVVTSGVIDGASVSGGADSGLFHVIEAAAGPAAAIRAMYDMQQLAINHLAHEGLTVGLGDLLMDRGAASVAPAGVMPPVDPTARDGAAVAVATVEVENAHQVAAMDAGDVAAPIGMTVDAHFSNIQINTLRNLDLSRLMMQQIDPRRNNLFRMISTGAKGKPQNFIMMALAIGLILIDGRLPPNNFGYKRTLPFFRRYDLSSRARGLIGRSYLTGLTPAEVFYVAMTERFSIITKAMYTAVVGAESRTAIKNLEPLVVNNYRAASSNVSLAQPICGNDGLDTRRVISMTLPTLTVSDADFEARWAGRDSPAGRRYAELVRADRAYFRRPFLQLAAAGNAKAASGEVSVAVDVRRVIDDVVRRTAAAADAAAAAAAGADAAVDQRLERVVEFTELVLPYVMVNRAAAAKRRRIPPHLVVATRPTVAVVRALLDPATVGRLTAPALEEILLRIYTVYQRALVAYGTAIGVKSAQCTSEPMTQFVLNAVHQAVAGGVKKQGVARVKEITGEIDDPKKRLNASMTIFLRSPTPTQVVWVTNNIERLRCRVFVGEAAVLEEPAFGTIVHPDLAADATVFDEFARYNPLIRPPSNLLRWVVRLTIVRRQLMIKNTTLWELIEGLRQLDGVFVVHSDENAPRIVVRLYWQASAFASYPSTAEMDAMMHAVLDTPIRGVDGVSMAWAEREVARPEVRADGALVVDRREPVIETTGSNLLGLATCPVHEMIDLPRVLSDSIDDVCRCLGIVAAETLIVEELHRLIGETNLRHLHLYATEMCSTGWVTSIMAAGLKARQAENILLRMAHIVPIASMVYAAARGVKASAEGLSPALILGAVPRLGTNYNNHITVNEEFVRANVRTEAQQMADLEEL